MEIPRISTFIIGLVWVSFFALAFGLFTGNLVSNYGTADYNGSDISVYNKLDKLANSTESYTSTTNIQQDSDLLDIVGGFFSSGYRVLSDTYNSVDVFREMTGKMLGQLPLGKIGAGLSSAIISTVLIFLLIGVILSALLKKDV